MAIRLWMIRENLQTTRLGFAALEVVVRLVPMPASLESTRKGSCWRPLTDASGCLSPTSRPRFPALISCSLELRPLQFATLPPLYSFSAHEIALPQCCSSVFSPSILCPSWYRGWACASFVEEVETQVRPGLRHCSLGRLNPIWTQGWRSVGSRGRGVRYPLSTGLVGLRDQLCVE